MRVRTDNLLFRVDRTWLGPKVLRFPWRATYTAYGIAVLVMAGSALLMIKLGVPVNIVSFAAWVVVSLLLTRWITRQLNPERPLRASLLRLWGELNAPRPRPQVAQRGSYALSAPRWHYGAAPERRKLLRLLLAVRVAVGRPVGAVLLRLGGGRIGQAVLRRTSGSTKTAGRTNKAAGRPRKAAQSDEAVHPPPATPATSSPFISVSRKAAYPRAVEDQEDQGPDTRGRGRDRVTRGGDGQTGQDEQADERQADRATA